VLITGTNGSGKSSFLSAVAHTVWGKSLSGAKLWSGKKGYTAASIDGVRYQRSQKKPKITWEGAADYESDKHAQDELNNRFGEFSHWRRSCVISSTDVDSFATATDAERKRFLEDVAGSALLERAHRVALDSVQTTDSSLKHELAAASSYASSVARLESLLSSKLPEMPADLEEYTDIPDPDVDKERKSALEARVREIQQVARTAQRDMDDLSRAMQRAKSDGEAARKRAEEAQTSLDKAHDGECPTCGQTLPAPERLITKFQTDMDSAKALLAECRIKYAAAKEEATEVKEDFTSLQGTVAEVNAELQEITALEREWRARQAAQKRADAEVRRAQQAVQAAHEQRAKAEAQLREIRELSSESADKVRGLEDSLEVAKQAAKVLSTKGVRAHILDDLIRAIQDEANTWLAVICGDRLSLELRAFGEKADGGVKSEVSFAVSGAGGGHGYKASSGGERRRIDIAITLALALVSEASSGRDGSTIWLDEPLDSLDQEGVDAVMQALRSLAKDRCVVLISHADVDKVDQWWRVERSGDKASLVRVH
jgi:DNA repair exonuclease SbcCD ATPase subunit